MRTPTTTLFKAVKLAKPNGNRTWMIQRRSHGKRERIYFETEREARKEASDRNRKIESYGTSVKLTPEEQINASACIADLAKIGRTLREATDYYLAAYSRPPAPTVEELCVKVLTEFRRRAIAGEISEKHEQSMQETIRKLRAQFGSIPIDKITIATVKDWLGTLKLAIRTRNRHLGYTYSIFQLASAKEWNMIEKNPLEDITKFTDPNEKGRKISIFRLRKCRQSYQLLALTGFHSSHSTRSPV
jgi:hypothetical protein